MSEVLAAKGPELIKQVNAVFHFEVREKEGDEATWFSIDLKNPPGYAKLGKEGVADATFTLLDDDLMAIANKTLNPQVAFFEGKMEIDGNMGAAMKFTPDLLG